LASRNQLGLESVNIMRTFSTLVSGLLALGVAADAGYGGTVVFPKSAGGTGNSYELVLDPSATAGSAGAASAASGGYLATITSAAEQSFIEDLLSNDAAPTGSYFFGLGRVGNTDSFGWSNGEPFSYQNFAAGEPNDYKSGEDAGQIYWTGPGDSDALARRGGWNDAPAAGYAGSTILDLNTAGFLIERPGVGGDGGNNNGGGGNGGNGGPAAVPLPPAVFAAPLAFLIGRLGFAAHRRRRAR
jgi:hypothetical protein